ncbi:MAG TPA: 1,2-phenylacetyl-CoA epoxidase subunit PaaC [Actinomycetota bacterium]|nr:1,2-phenylacetyl-CoA epoxidase subunit PaaC [Actinomycetota bacterium]
MSDSLIALLIALADDELILGHRHSEWTGFAPYIEEDVAFSSIAQDEIGHAAALYTRVGALNGDDPDRLGLGRNRSEYRHAVICERSNKDWAYTLARHWLYDTADSLRLEALEATADAELSALVVKMRREERYHLLHADAWMKRVAEGPVEGRTFLIDALHDAFAESLGLFEPIELEEEAIKEGWLPVPSDELRSRFMQSAGTALDSLGLPTDIPSKLDERAEFVASSSGDLIASDGSQPVDDQPHGLGGRRGHHTDEFDSLWEDLTHTYREVPGASW